jgi:hypothetical protein
MRRLISMRAPATSHFSPNVRLSARAEIGEKFRVGHAIRIAGYVARIRTA